jgi:hypothetical protein
MESTLNPRFLKPGTKSENSFLCHGTVNISPEKSGGGGIRGYLVPWHNKNYCEKILDLKQLKGV